MPSITHSHRVQRVKMESMHRLAVAMFLLLLAASALLCAAEPAFEVASVKLSEPFTMERIGSPQQDRVVSISPVRATFRNCTLLGLVARAWRVKEYQVSGPEWMRDQRFDIFAKLPQGACPTMRCQRCSDPSWRAPQTPSAPGQKGTPGLRSRHWTGRPKSWSEAGGLQSLV